LCDSILSTEKIKIQAIKTKIFTFALMLCKLYEHFFNPKLFVWRPRPKNLAFEELNKIGEN